MPIFKKNFCISLILAAVLLSGCQKKDENSQSESYDVSSVQSEESSLTNEDGIGYDDSPQGDISNGLWGWYGDISRPQNDSTPEVVQPNYDYSASRVYADDELVPSDWLRVDSRAEALTRVNDIITANTSGEDTESAVLALMNKNLLFYEIFYVGNGEVFTLDRETPYYYDDLEDPVYPVTSEYFTDVQSIYDLAYDTYKTSVAEEFLFGTYDRPRRLFAEENGIMYLNITALPIWWSIDPFIARSYLEITDKTDNKCTFIWHYPDIEMLNSPQNGYEYFYLKKTCTAEYIDGSWKLDRIIFNNELSDE